MSNRKFSSYTIGSSDPRDVLFKPKRRSFRKWIKDYILRDDENNPIPEAVPSSVAQSDGFNKQFEGWNIRLHRANGGHIVEAWKNDDMHVVSSSSRRPHELFMVMDNEDMGTRLNDILVQLMLRG